MAAPVRTLATGGVVTSIELSKDGRHLTTADGKEVKVGARGLPHVLELSLLADKRFASGCTSGVSNHLSWEVGEMARAADTALRLVAGRQLACIQKQ